MKLSVIIPCYNAEKTIGDQLDALAAQSWSYQWEVIVADNGSTDNSWSLVKRYQNKLPSLLLIDASQIPGPSYARNRGVERAKGEIIAFLDADDVVGDNWLQAIGESLLIHDFVASRFDGMRLNESGNTSVPQMNGLLPSPYLPFSGACGLGVKKSIHFKIGGFDENFFACEDGDYCWRMQLEGVPLYYERNAVVHIRNKKTSQQRYKQGIMWGEYNVLLIKKFGSSTFHVETSKS